MLRLLYITLLFLLFFSRNYNGYSKSGNIDMIIVVDTSGSMRARVQGTKIRRIDLLLEKFQCFLNELNPGDNVALFTFDTTTKFHSLYTIRNRKDRQRLYEKFLSFEATGQYTHMSQMIDVVFAKVKELEIKFPDHYKIIYLISDGKNDPPPNVKSKQSSNEIYEKFKKHKKNVGKDLSIYYFPIALGKGKAGSEESQIVEGMRDYFQGETISIDLGSVSASKSLIETLKKARELKKSKQEPDVKLPPPPSAVDITLDHLKVYWWIYLSSIVVIFVIAVLVLIVLNLRKDKKATVRGQLEVINKKIRYSRKKLVDLKSFWKKEVTIGATQDCDVVLEGLESDYIIVIQAYYKKRRMYRLIDKNNATHFIKKQKPDRLVFGDSFEFANYQINFIL